MKSIRALGALAVVTLTGTIVLGLALPATFEQRTYSRMVALHPPIAWTAYVAFGITAAASVLYLMPEHASAALRRGRERFGRTRRAVHGSYARNRQPVGPPDLGCVVDMGRAPHHHRAHAGAVPRVPCAALDRGRRARRGRSARR